MRRLIALAALSFAATLSHAQIKAPSPNPLPVSIATHPNWPSAKNPADVDSIDHLVSALYDVISGPAGKPRDWNRFRSLFLPDGRLGVIRAATPAADGKAASSGDVVLFAPDTYVERDAPYFAKNGFFEQGIAQRTEEFGNLAMVWTTYESRHNAEDAKPFARGINCLQLAHAQGRYWIASIVWDDEREGLVLPEKYLKTPAH
jgi:hypothetical protein